MGGGGINQKLAFKIEKIGEKQFSKTKAVDRHYKICIDPQHLNGKKLTDMHNELHDMFERALKDVKQNLQGNDLGRVVIHHPSLNHEIVVPLRPLDELDADAILENVENVLSSNENLPMDEDFDVSIGSIELPKGGGKNTYISDLHSNNSIMKKKSIGYIKKCR